MKHPKITGHMVFLKMDSKFARIYGKHNFLGSFLGKNGPYGQGTVSGGMRVHGREVWWEIRL